MLCKTSESFVNRANSPLRTDNAFFCCPDSKYSRYFCCAMKNRAFSELLPVPFALAFVFPEAILLLLDSGSAGAGVSEGTPSWSSSWIASDHLPPMMAALKSAAGCVESW